jgi:hypothetical protein
MLFVKDIEREENIMSKKELKYEGKEAAWVDLDRMTNEGLAGGYVTGEYDHEQIEEAVDIPLHEEPPRNTEKKDSR